MSQSAFSFWRDRDEEPEDKTQGHSNTQSPVLKSTLSPFRQSERNSPRLSAAPPSRLLVSPSGKANQLRNDYPLRPRPRVSPTVSSSLKPRSPVLTGQTAVTSVKTVSPATRAKGTSLHACTHTSTLIHVCACMSVHVHVDRISFRTAANGLVQSL